jgi:hypothetical protein
LSQGLALPVYQGTYAQYQSLPENTKRFYQAPPITQTEPMPWVYQGPQPQGSQTPLPSSGSRIIIPDAGTPTTQTLTPITAESLAEYRRTHAPITTDILGNPINPATTTEVFTGQPTTVLPSKTATRESPTNTTAGPPVQITVTTTQPEKSPLETAMAKYQLTPQPTPNIYGGGTRTEQTPIAFSPAYTPAEKAALSEKFSAETRVKVANLGLTLVTPLAGVAAPVVAAKGALISLGISQAAKGITGGGLLTPQEAFQAGTVGALFSVGATGILGVAAGKAPVLLEKSFEGSLTRIAASGALGAAGGGVIGGVSAAVEGGDVGAGALAGARTGAVFGLALGTVSEVAPYAWSAAKQAGGKIATTLNPERAMYSKVMGEAKAPTSLTEKIIGKIAPERAMISRALTPAGLPETSISPSVGKSEFKPYTNKGEYTPSSSGKSFTEQILYKQASAVKAGMKPMLGTQVYQVPKSIVVAVPVISAQVKAITQAPKTQAVTVQKQTQVQETIQRQVQNPILSYQG